MKPAILHTAPTEIITRENTIRGNWTDNPCFYVSVVDGPKFAIVLGPFQEESECRQWAYNRPEQGGDPQKHDKMYSEATRHDPKSVFYSWGMVKMQNGHREGVLNKFLGM